MERLNLGCGTDIRDGWVNLDRIKLPGVDVCHDLDTVPYPFPDNHFDLILASHVLEHVSDFIATMREVHRILKPRGSLIIRVPHFTSKDAHSDPTHRRAFSARTFDYFVVGHQRNYYFDFLFQAVRQRCLRFQKRLAYPWNFLYEGSPLRMFPAYELYVELVK